jgi:Fur family transcriptional regulator, ferric uptake regulator
MRSPQTVLNSLRGAGLRISTARRAVVEALFVADRPVSAEAIAGGLDGRSMPLDLASTYRNLEVLERLGLVRHLHAGHGPGRYVLTRGEQREYLSCESCGELVEAEPGQLDLIRAEIRTRFGYEARFDRFPLTGLCSRCRGR